jgi:hypothetical protein
MVKIICMTPQGREISTNLAALLTPDLRETVRVEANRWIKHLRLVRYGSSTMRERFTYRDDSLWWFTELYLHKMRRVDDAIATVVALEAAREKHHAARLVIDSADQVVRDVAGAFSRAHGFPVDVRGAPPRTHATAWPSYLIGLTTRLSRLRPARPPVRARRTSIVAFVHTAFWKAVDPQQESYIGPVLDALAKQVTADDLFFVGVGPRRNFRARRWWDPLTPATGVPPVTPIERFAPQRALAGSLALWRRRRELAHQVTSGDDVRAAAIFRGCDLWPVLRRELEAAAVLQWPWSARAMDEAAAALDALEPAAVLTYAEAGGWGRALILEARRRGIRSAGIQHGFIYRHWLNYLHESDEMATLGPDHGFPRPDRTLLYDRYAADHLERAGHFPSSSLAITGSVRLEELATRLVTLRTERLSIRGRLGIPDERGLAVLAAKFTEIRDELPTLIEAVSFLDRAHLMIRPHPAETADVYADFIGGRSNVSVAPADADLASLLAAADGLVTMNSTVAIDGLVLGLPALVIGLPNNLSPFVAAGVMLGADGPEKIQQGLEALLYDRQVRQRLADAAGRFVAEYRLAPEPGAAGRAVAEILTLARK